MRHFSFLFSILLTYSLISLEKPLFLKYFTSQDHDYKKIQLVFEDNFDDDRNNWLKEAKQDTGITASITDGELKIQNNRHSEQWVADIEKELDYSRDFEIRFSFKIIKTEGRNKPAGSVYWGVNDSTDFSWISLSRKSLELINCHGGDHKKDERQFVKIYPALKKDVFYKIAIRKVNDKYSLFLDDRFEAELPYSKLSANTLACAAEKKSTMIFDNLRVYYLD